MQIAHSDSPARSASSNEAEPANPLRWFALRLRSRFEFAVRDGLRAASIDEFLPVFTQESRWTDRTAITTRPLFSGYIFARFDPTIPANLAAVRLTRGVVEILSINGKPSEIPDAQIANLQRLAAIPGAVSPCAYVAGETVTVARGPFAGVAGVVARVKQGPNQSATTLTIPIEILGRAVRVDIDAADVETNEK